MKIILSAINSRHTHSAIALNYLKSFWERVPGRPTAKIREFDINQTNESIYAELIGEKPDIIAFSVYIWSLDRVLATASALKAALPGVIIILGGPEVSYTDLQLLEQNPFLDFIVRGEGEASFEDLLVQLLHGNNGHNVPGTSGRTDSRIWQNADRPLKNDIDEIPSPFQNGLFGRGHGFTYYEASRGCPSKCTYCLSSVQGNVRNHSLNRVKADLDWFFTSGFRQIRFADRTFNFDKKRAIEIIKYIQAGNKQKINFHFEIQADFLSDEIIELLGQAPEGMFHLEIGVQSTNPASLSAVKRRFDLEKLKSVVKKLKQETGCHLHLDILGGLPHDTFADFRQSLDDVWNLSPHSIQISLVKVLRGTPLENDVRDKNIFCIQKPPYTVLRTRWLSADEAVLIQDVGKLVEGVYNCARFPLSLNFFVNDVCRGQASDFFVDMAKFWREKQILFYNFSPENIRTRLLEYMKNLEMSHYQEMTAEILLEHEFHLCQKVPTGESKVGPDVQTGKSKNRYKVTPGLKSFWYKLNLPEILSGSRSLESGAFPSVYRYEKDLSSVPDTRLLNLDLAENFVLACFQSKISEENFAEEWHKAIPESYPFPDFSNSIEKLLSEGLLYDPKEKNYQQVKDLIDKSQNST
jgi:radical SAM superfamily enzyme YgiQ (UPF0313 family)